MLPFESEHLTSIAKILADTDAGFTGSQIEHMLRECRDTLQQRLASPPRPWRPRAKDQVRDLAKEADHDSARVMHQWSAPQSAAHRGELRVTSARYSAGLRIPSAEWGAWVL